MAIATMNDAISKTYQSGYHKGINDFTNKFNEMCNKYPIAISKKNSRPLYAHVDGTWHDLINDIAEQLKGE